MKEKEQIPSIESLGDDIAALRSKIYKQVDLKPRDSSFAMRIGVEFAAGAFVGGFVGFWADKFFSTSPIFFIICFFLGSAGGFLTVYRTVMKEEKIEDKVD